MKIYCFTPIIGGGVIVNIFKEKLIGLIGVIGGYYISKYSTDWYSSHITKGKIIQGRSNKQSYQSNLFDVNNYNYGPYVAAVDGLWMCIPKQLFAEGKIHWDNKTYKGFHLYDFDMCMQINSQGYKIQIANNILIEHKSAGNPNKIFYENCILFHEKWNSRLPFASSPQIKKEDIENYELNIFKGICTYTLLYKEQQQILNQPLHKLVSKITLLWQKWIK